jgi:hypothetical protein
MKTLLEGIIEGFVREAPQDNRDLSLYAYATDTKRLVKYGSPETAKDAINTDPNRRPPGEAPPGTPGYEEPEGQPADGEEPQTGQQRVAQDDAPKEIPQGTLSDSDDELSDNGIKQTALNKGYVKNAPHTAPGNAGSMFHEIVTGEVSNWLFEDDSIIKAFLEPDGKWSLNAKSSTCRKAARASIKKYLFVKAGVDALVTKRKLTEPIKVRNYFGAQESIQKQKELIEQCSKVEGGGNFYTPSGVQIDSKDLLFFIEKSGGGENPADTATIAMDDNCNGVVSFHSDKMSPSDPQANSSINAEFEFFVKEMEKIRDVGLSDREIKKARNIIIEGAEDVRRVERQLKRSAEIAAGVLVGYTEDEIKAMASRVADKNFEIGGKKNRANPTSRYKPIIQDIKPDDPRYAFYNNYCGDDCDKPEGRLRAFLKYMADPQDFCRDEEGNEINFRGKQWMNRKEDQYNDCKPHPTEDMVTLMERLASTEYLHRKYNQETDDSPEKTKKLSTSSRIGQIREETARSLQNTHDELNKTRITYPPGDPNGREIGLGDYLEAKNVIEKFHLALLDDREREGGGRSLGAYDNLLNINMTDVLSTAKDIGACLEIENADDLISSFSVGPPEDGDEFIRDTDTQEITGRKVFIYMVGGEGEKVKIGEKILRTKSGKQGKWETLYHWSKETQECLKDPPEPQQEESLSPRQQQLRNELKKLVRDIAINRLGDYGN